MALRAAIVGILGSDQMSDFDPARSPIGPVAPINCERDVESKSPCTAAGNPSLRSPPAFTRGQPDRNGLRLDDGKRNRGVVNIVTRWKASWFDDGSLVPSFTFIPSAGPHAPSCYK